MTDIPSNSSSVHSEEKNESLELETQGRSTDSEQHKNLDISQLTQKISSQQKPLFPNLKKHLTVILILFLFIFLLEWIYILDKIIIRTNVIYAIPENWRPTPSQELSIKVALKRPSLMRFTLFNTSNYRGSSLNNGENTSKDFVFVKSAPILSKITETKDGYSAETPVISSEANLTIKALDGAAYTRLKVEYLENGTWKPCQTQSGVDFLTIPVDKNYNHISDAWEKKYKLFVKKTGVSGTAITKSGLTILDSYRGINTINGWSEINPNKRAIFINNQDGLDLSGLNHLGFIPYFISEEQYQSNDIRIIDKNGSANHYGIYLTKSPKDDKASYYALNIPSDAKSPAETERIIINSDLIAAHSEILRRLKEINAKDAKKLELNEEHFITRQIAVATGLAKSLPVPKKPDAATLGEMRKDFEAGYYN